VRNIKLILTTLALIGVWLAVPMSASAQTIDEIAGTWVGDSLRRVNGDGAQAGASGLNAGDVKIIIKQKGKRFSVAWTAFVLDKDGTLSLVPVGAVFEPTERTGIYSADDIDGDRFDESESGNPLEGEPMVWAHVVGTSLTLQSFVLDERGRFVLDRLQLDVIEGSMSLEFLRMDAEEERFGLRGQLKKKGG